MKTQAAVLSRPGEPIRMVDLDLEPPRAGEVLVAIGASGVCHSDLSVFTGRLPNPLPVVLGHEGAGTVVEVGEDVTELAAGDRVVLSWLTQCGRCFYCQHEQPSLCDSGTAAMARGTMPDGTTRYRWNGEPVYHMAGLGTFSRHCVVPARAAVKLPPEMDLAPASLIGCGVLTGFGAAVNTARVAVGESVAVIGCGGVGLNAIQGARISGARQIIAIDPSEERLAFAREFGATLRLQPGAELIRQIRKATEGRGVDAAIEVVGHQDTVRDAVRMTRRGGRAVLVGAGPDDVVVNVPSFTGIVMTEKTIRGSLYGSAHVHREVQRLIGLYEQKLLKLDELVTRTFEFPAVNDALDYCASGRGARAVLRF
ncbi:Zn-dependent alcohol dehydrogenase [Paraburkholderia fungorum]|uniref:Zn-dependent alcohol dehydrogenase n=1 Tax=Paraburkholderia fungorum TaxID=134537 RepID=UPI0004AA66B5|nr:Zn-dependent alcohol dehydrogenase [Paraburkholderia fungorum]KFX67214.1 hypothetical protein KBK24_0103220 [Burkholderia sp. K24]USX04859.1 Zn-dependent alcohol dehydrogenase [Paraburkholderia fungorum]